MHNKIASFVKSIYIITQVCKFKALHVTTENEHLWLLKTSASVIHLYWKNKSVVGGQA